MSAAILYSTRFGCTERVAKAIERGLQVAGLQTRCLNTEGFDAGSLKAYDLICVGGPTEAFSATKQLKEFLSSMGRVDLREKLGFAFETRVDWRLSGSAAKYIEHALDDQGLRIAQSRESAIVNSLKEGGKIVGAELRAGEEERFEEVGSRLARAASNLGSVQGAG